MGLSNALNNAMDFQRTFDMASERSLDEIYEILKAEASVVEIGAPELKKGLFGKSIKFPKISKITPVLTVKGTKVTIKKETDGSGSSVSVGGFKVAGSAGVKVKDVEAGGEYYANLCDAVKAVLEGK